MPEADQRKKTGLISGMISAVKDRTNPDYKTEDNRVRRQVNAMMDIGIQKDINYKAGAPENPDFMSMKKITDAANTLKQSDFEVTPETTKPLSEKNWWR